MTIDRKTLANSLDETRRDAVALARSLTPEDMKTPMRDGTWTVKDMLIHMATSEAGLVNTAKRIAGGQPHASPGFDIHLFNQRQVEKNQETSVDDLLARLEVSRAEMHKTLEQMTEEELGVQGFMSSGTPIDVLGVFKRIGDHEQEHCRDIRAAIGR